MKKIIALILCLMLVVTVFAGCGDGGKTEDPVINVAVHKNMGAALVAVAEEQGYFKSENVKVKITAVDGGVPEIAAMRADKPTLDIGYIGAGVSWNIWDPAGNQLEMLYLDNLGDAEVFMANKSVGIDQNTSNLDVAKTLKGKKVYMEVGTTPGQWFIDYVGLLNEEFENDSDKLWIESTADAFLKNYKAPNTDPKNKVIVENMSNSNLTAAMATTAGNEKVELAVAYTPVPGAIFKSNTNVVQVATTGTKFPKEKLSPGVWIGATEFVKENEELVQRFINALVKASNYTSNDQAAAARAAERLCNLADGTVDEFSCIYPSQAEMKEWFKDYSSIGYTYMNSLYNSRVGNVPPESGAPKTLGEAFNSKFMMKALRTVK